MLTGETTAFRGRRTAALEPSDRPLRPSSSAWLLRADVSGLPTVADPAQVRCTPTHFVRRRGVVREWVADRHLKPDAVNLDARPSSRRTTRSNMFD